MVLTKYNKNHADYKPPKESDPSLVVGITHMVKLYMKYIILDYFYFCNSWCSTILFIFNILGEPTLHIKQEYKGFQNI